MHKQRLSVEYRVYDREPFTRAELVRLVGDRPVRESLNPRSPAYRTLGLADRSIGKREFMDLVLKDPNLLRRPLLVKGRRYIFGFDPDLYATL